jgi:outer membrane receptor protein involved in Fe transport
MNPSDFPGPHLRRLLVLLPVLVSAPFVWAQSAPPPAASPADLARYDRNRNGRLDPEELAAKAADEARARSAAAPRTGADRAALPGIDDPTVFLSPFEVRETTTGYYASTTMSGTRLNTPIEDLASSLSVVTKQQMADFAMLDLNDIFLYESNTEGTGNYTAFAVDRGGNVSDQLQDNPQGANRVRGLGPANIAIDNFATSGRVPVDPIDIDAVEISRGPNSSIFGLGDGAGTVNMVSSTANLSRSFATATARIDHLGGWRTSLDVNRNLLPGKFALRASHVYQHDAFERKPSGYETRRFNVMVRVQPFKYTSVRASFQSYHGVGTRATGVTPRDAVSYWKSVGAPTWDPPTATVTRDGVASVAGTTVPVGLFAGFSERPTLFITPAGVTTWMIQRTPAAGATTGPNNISGPLRMLETSAEPVRTNAPLFSTVPGVSDRSIYNWRKINLAAPNTIKDQVETSTVTIEQFVLDGDVNKLAFQFAWQREDADRINRNVVGQTSATGNSNYLYIDVNARLLDGRPNPNFLEPYIGVFEPVAEERPYERDSYRGQGVYALDLRQAEGWKRWLGRHQVLGYYEERKSKSYRYRFRDAMISDHPIYAPAGVPKGNQSGNVTSPIATRGYFRYYVGDNQGYDVDRAPNGYELGQYTFHWYDAVNTRWVADSATLGRAAINEGSAGGSALLNLIKTRGGVAQSSLLQDRVVVTLGRREDENRNKSQKPSVLKPSGWEYDYAAMDGWVGDWALRSGETTTRGVVVRPFRDFGFTNRLRNSGGVTGFAGEALAGLQLHYNKSDSFRPMSPAISILLEDLPNWTSHQKEYGFSLNLWTNKLVLRANRYTNNQINARTGDIGTFVSRTLRVEGLTGNDAMSLQNQATLWVTQLNPTFSTTQVQARVNEIMGITPEQRDRYLNNPISETTDVLGKGDEYELHFNPTRFWTFRLNATRQDAIDANLARGLQTYLDQRIPFWQSIIDPRTNTPWFTTPYTASSSGVPRNFLQTNVIAPLNLATATEGLRRTQIREWRVNMSTSYRLAGMTEHRYLQHVTVGGGIRWEDKASIGYYGVPVNGNMSAAMEFDPSRPIYDKSRAYADVWASYSTRLFGDKVRARFQLNVRNVQESGRLQAIGAFPDGRPHTFRIIDPRMYIFSTTFDL